MALDKVPPASGLSDRQFIQINGPDGITTGFQYDQQQRTLYFKESQVIYPSYHGHTHVAEDPVPDATCDNHGLMSADDKCKLDSLVGTRLGVAGFQGSGFPDDGGWMQGDVIFAAGTEFISIERIGNVIRFVVDSPVPLNCSCESCTSIYWVQDETDVQAVRPPTCGGKMPGVNAYGELKLYLFPESAIFDPNNPSAKLNQKGQYPAFIFKRYDNSIVPGSAEWEVILKRDSNNLLQTEIGMAFTPGQGGPAQCVYFVGKDSAGGQLRFELAGDQTPGMLGSLLYNGNLITKKSAVIVDYTAGVLSNNQYVCNWWNVDQHKPIGDQFVATNVWQYTNPTNPTTGQGGQALVLDVGVDILPVGTLVDVWFYQVGSMAGVPIRRYYFSKRPELNPQSLWTSVGAVQFGDLATVRAESLPDFGSEDKHAGYSIPATRVIERTQWGVSGFDDPFLLYDDVANEGGTEGVDLTVEHRAYLDVDLPGLRVAADFSNTGNYSERPVFIWNRHQMGNSLVKAEVGRPERTQSIFSPFDLLLNAQIDSVDQLYLKVMAKGTVNGTPYVRIKGCHFNDLPPSGVLRVITPGARFNSVFHYGRKLVWTTSPDDGMNSFVLLSDYTYNETFPGNVGDIVELLHDDYSAPCVRVEFTPADDTSGSVRVQFKVGELDMTVAYENDNPTGSRDDYSRGLTPGYTVSQVYTQSATYSGVGTAPASVPEGFVVYDGGAQSGGDLPEYWNRLEVMHRDGQCWIWWNGLLVAPSTQLSAALETPVIVSTPYFPLPQRMKYGKVGMRLWPGATLRSFEVRTQAKSFSEFSYGQLQIT